MAVIYWETQFLLKYDIFDCKCMGGVKWKATCFHIKQRCLICYSQIQG